MANVDDFYTVLLREIPFTIRHQYQDLRFIGNGVHGVVCAARDTETGRRVAIKKMTRPFERIERAKKAYRELSILRVVNHRNIIQLLDSFTPQRTLQEFTDFYLVTELMDAELTEVMGMEYQENFNHDHLSFLLYQMLCGIHDLHSIGVIHRDLKPANIVVNHDCTLKIIDFGLARPQAQIHQMTPYVTTRYYRAPEVVLETNYTSKVDIWSIGCIFGEMIRGAIVFPGQDFIDQWRQIIRQLRTPNWGELSFFNQLGPAAREHVLGMTVEQGFPFEMLFPDENFPRDPVRTRQARDLLSRMLVIDPVNRISIEEAFQHPYIRIWFDENEVSRVQGGANPLNDEQMLTLQECKERIFNLLQY